MKIFKINENKIPFTEADLNLDVLHCHPAATTCNAIRDPQCVDNNSQFLQQAVNDSKTMCV